MADFTLHFGYSRSKHYPQLLELAALAKRHECVGEGKTSGTG